MLPTVEFLKEQANRLIAYMGDKHRFRLRQGSAHEALAAMYGQRDWNTLQARASRDGQPQAGCAEAASVRYPLDWGPHGERMHVSRSDWQRHVLTEGGTVAQRREWLQRHLAGQIEREGAGVFVNIFGGALSNAESEVLQEHAQLLDLASGRGPACNVFAELPADVTAAILIHALDERLPYDVFWRARVTAAVTTLLMVLDAQRTHITLKRLCTELRQLGADRGKALLASCPRGADAWPVAQSLYDSLGGEGGGDDGGESGEVGSLRRLFLETAGYMEQWLQIPGLELLFAEHVNAPGLLAMMMDARCLVIEMAAQDTARHVRLQGAILQYVAREAVSRSLALPREARNAHPRLFALSEGHEYLVPAVRRLLEQGRAAGWTVLLTIPDAYSLRRIPGSILSITGNVWNETGLSLAANVWNRMYLGGGVPEQVLSEVVARLQVADAVVVSPSSVQFTT